MKHLKIKIILWKETGNGCMQRRTDRETKQKVKDWQGRNHNLHAVLFLLLTYFFFFCLLYSWFSFRLWGHIHTFKNMFYNKTPFAPLCHITTNMQIHTLPLITCSLSLIKSPYNTVLFPGLWLKILPNNISVMKQKLLFFFQLQECKWCAGFAIPSC